MLNFAWNILDTLIFFTSVKVTTSVTHLTFRCRELLLTNGAFPEPVVSYILRVLLHNRNSCWLENKSLFLGSVLDSIRKIKISFFRKHF